MSRSGQAVFRQMKKPVHGMRKRSCRSLSWSSQARGFFTGRFKPEVRDHADLVRVFYNDGNWERFERAKLACCEEECQSPFKLRLLMC